IPADRLTNGPIRVSAPIAIERSPNTAPGGKAAIDPRPKAANWRPAGVSAVTAPARCAAPHAQCTARHRSSRSQPPLIGRAGSWAGRGGELAAGTVDLAAAGVPHRDRHAVGLQAADELVLVG